jgi:ribosomal protein S17
MVAEQVSITVTVVAIDKAAQTVTIKGPEGRTETVKARDPKNLDALSVGDLVEITYTQALAVALDKSAAK